MEISKSFILEAHKAACKDWKAKIEAEFPELFRDVLADEIKQLPAYRKLSNTCTVENQIRITPNRISIGLPVSNRNWTLAAWELAKAICDTFDFYPVHGHKIEQTDALNSTSDINRVIVLEK